MRPISGGTPLQGERDLSGLNIYLSPGRRQSRSAGGPSNREAGSDCTLLSDNKRLLRFRVDDQQDDRLRRPSAFWMWAPLNSTSVPAQRGVTLQRARESSRRPLPAGNTGRRIILSAPALRRSERASSSRSSYSLPLEFDIRDRRGIPACTLYSRAEKSPIGRPRERIRGLGNRTNPFATSSTTTDTQITSEPADSDTTIIFTFTFNPGNFQPFKWRRTASASSPSNRGMTPAAHP